MKDTSYTTFATPFGNDAVCPVFGYFQASQLFGLMSLLQNTVAGDFMLLRLMVDSDTMGDGFGLGLSKDLEMGEWNVVNWMLYKHSQ